MENEQRTLVNLLNPKFNLSFAGKDYEVKKASIAQVQRYQLRVSELSQEKETPVAVRDLEILAYCIYLALSKNNPEVSLDYIKDNIPGDTDILEMLVQLGFIAPQKAEAARKLQEKILSISENSSQT